MYQHSSLINPVRVYIADIIYLSKLEKKVNLFKIKFVFYY